MDKEKIAELIKELETKRDTIIQEFNAHPMVIQANSQLAYLNGKIDALKGLIVEEQSDKQD